jgi:6-phosphogluconolactonase
VALLTIAADEHALAGLVAQRVAAAVHDALQTRDGAAVCLTGGTTPRRAYQLLANDPWRSGIAGDRVDVYWSDERHVPPEHEQSNYRMARESLLMHVPVPAPHIHRIRGELAPDEAARLYERELPKRFDLTLLGVGEDAHVASIFPGSPLLAERTGRAASVWVPHLHAYRITLTPRSLLESDRILVVVAGAAKAAAVAAALDGPTDVERWPVHLLREAAGRVEWFIDGAAARDVSSRHA